MKGKNIDWFNNEVPRDIRKKSTTNICVMAMIQFIVLFFVLVVINPFGESIVPEILMTVFIPSFFLMIGFLGKRNHPSKVGFSNYAIYLKREDKVVKSIPWRKVIKVSDDGKRVIYSSPLMYGAGLPQQLFSEARLEVLDYWEKYKEYKDTNPKYRLDEKKQDLKSSKKRVVAVFIALLVSLVSNLWIYFNAPFYELIISFVGGTILLTIVLIYFIREYQYLKTDISKMENELKDG